MRTSSLLSLAVLVTLAACSAPEQKPAQASAAPQASITVHAKDYAYMAPDTVPAGMVSIHLINDGPGLHHVSVVRLDSGKTSADLDAAIAKPGPLPAWAVLLGGPNAPAPGDSATAALALTPGHYDILCFVDMPGGVPHFARGMSHPFVVNASNDATAAPAADVALNLVDYGFEFSKPLTTGHHVVAVTDSAAQPHELIVARLAPGKTGEDLLKWIADPKGPPPGQPIGGAAVQGHGTTVYVSLDITPGTYFYFCMVPDAKDGKPHIAHGMMHTETIS